MSNADHRHDEMLKALQADPIKYTPSFLQELTYMLRMEELEVLPEYAAAELLNCNPEDLEHLNSSPVFDEEIDLLDGRAADDVVALSDKGLEAEAEYILSQFESYLTVPEILEELDYRLDDSIWRRSPIIPTESPLEPESSILIGT